MTFRNIYKLILRSQVRQLKLGAVLVLNIWLTGWLPVLYFLLYIYFMGQPVAVQTYYIYLGAGVIGGIIQGYLFGFFGIVGLTSPLRSIRYLNANYTIPRSKGIRTARRSRLLYRILMRLPYWQAIYVAMSTTAAALAAGGYQWLFHGLEGRYLHYAIAPLLTGFTAMYLAYLATDLFLGDFRQRLRKSISMQGGDIPPTAGLSLKSIGYGMFGLSVVVLWMTNAVIYRTTTDAQPERVYYALLFCLLVVAGTWIPAFFMFRALYLGVKNLEEAAHRMLRRTKAWLFSKSGNQEISFAATAYHTAWKKISSHEQELLREVARKTRQLRNKDILMQKELDLAGSIQKRLMTDGHLSRWSELEIEAHFRPLYKVSGDYYDFFEIDYTQLGFVLCDVSGHGVPAALVTVMAKFAFQVGFAEQVSLPYIFDHVNMMLLESLKSEVHLTAFAFILDRFNSMSYACAAHIPGLLYRAKTGRLELLSSQGFMLGAFIDASFSHESPKIDVDEGDILVAITDGLLEVRDSRGEEYGFARLVSNLEDYFKVSPVASVLPQLKEMKIEMEEPPQLRRHRPVGAYKLAGQVSASSVKAAIIDDVERFRTAAGRTIPELRDDQTVVVFKFGRPRLPRPDIP